MPFFNLLLLYCQMHDFEYDYNNVHMAYCAFLLMKKLTRLKSPKQQIDVLSLPQIHKKSVSVPSPHVSITKIKIDIKKPLSKLRKSSPLLHLQKRQS